MADDPYAALGKPVSAPAPADPYAAMGTPAPVATKQANGRWLLDPAAPQPAPTDDSRGRGFLLGAMKPIDNIASWVDAIPGVHEVNDAVAHATGLPTTAEVVSGNDAARANNSRTGYQTAGGILGTLPTLELPGGLLAQGGAAGALLSDAKSAPGVAIDAAKGAVGSLVGGKLLSGLGSVIAPRVSQAVSALQQAGVNLAPGQYLRALGEDAQSWAGRLAAGVGASLEDHATSLPIVGRMISDARREATDGFNRGAAGQTLGIMGETLPDAVQTGHGMAGYLRSRFNQNYDDVLARMQMIPDDQLHGELRDVASRMTDGTMNADTARQLRQTMQSVLGYRIPAMREVPGTPFVSQETGNLPAVINTGSEIAPTSTGLGPYGGQAAEGAGAAAQPPRARFMSGETLKAVDSDLRKRAGATQDPTLKAALNDIRQAVRGAASRSSDATDAQRLSDIDRAYAHFAVIRNAASKADGGIFTPRQLDTASRIADTSIAKGRSSEGNALFQRYAENGVNVLQGKTGDSGTFTRAATFNPYYWALGALGAPAYAGARRAVPLLTRPAGPNAQRAAALLQTLSPAAGVVAAPIAQSIGNTGP